MRNIIKLFILLILAIIIVLTLINYYNYKKFESDAKDFIGISNENPRIIEHDFTDFPYISEFIVFKIDDKTSEKLRKTYNIVKTLNANKNTNFNATLPINKYINFEYIYYYKDNYKKQYIKRATMQNNIIFFEKVDLSDSSI